jgi:hypothetical protein
MGRDAMETRQIVAVAITAVLLVAGGAAFIIFIQNPGGDGNTTTTTESDNDPTASVDVMVGDSTQTYSFAELKGLPSITGEGGYMKSTGTIVGPFTYTGVSVYTLLSSVAEVPAGYTLEVRSGDGYTTYFTRAQVEGRFDGYTPTGEPAGVINCTLLLAYYEDGAPLPTGGPLRIVTLNEGGNLTDGHFWAKDVVNITLIDEVEPWELQLKGIETWNMTHDDYYSVASCPHHSRSITVGSDTYSGVALWTVVSAMDGADDEHYLFNGSLALEGYDVVITDGEGNNVTISSISLAYNYSIIVAGWMNETLLEAPEWPLTLVTSAGVLISNIVSMEMIFAEE